MTIPQKDLPALAARLTEGKTQLEIAEETGERQSEVSKALRGYNNACAVRIIEHYAGVELKPAYTTADN